MGTGEGGRQEPGPAPGTAPFPGDARSWVSTGFPQLCCQVTQSSQ